MDIGKLKYLKFVVILFFPVLVILLIQEWWPLWILFGFGWLAVYMVILPLFHSFRALSLWEEAGRQIELFIGYQEGLATIKKFENNDLSFLKIPRTKETMKKNKNLRKYMEATGALHKYIEKQQKHIDNARGTLQKFEDIRTDRR